MSEDDIFSADADVRLPSARELDRPYAELTDAPVTLTRALSGGSETTVDLTVGLPADALGAGTYYLFAVINGSATVLEANFDNNTLESDVTFEFQPDLLIVPTLATTGEKNVGDELRIDYQLLNQGTAPIDTVAIRGFYQFLGQSSSPSSSAPKIPFGETSRINAQVLPGAAYSGTFTSTIPALSAGNYRFGITVDPQNEIEELNEVNNEASDARTTNYIHLNFVSNGSNDLKAGADFEIIAAPTDPDGIPSQDEDSVTFVPGDGAQWVNTTDVDAINTATNASDEVYQALNGNALVPPVLDLQAGHSASFELEIEGPVVIEFTWGIGAGEAAPGEGASNDSLTFTVDGAAPLGKEDQATISGDDGWRTYRQLIEAGAGARTLRWTFTRGTGAPSAYAFIDDISLQEELRPDLTVETVDYNVQGISPFVLLRDDYLDIVVNGINIGAAMPQLDTRDEVPGNVFNVEVRLSKDKVWGNDDDVFLGVLEEIENLDANGRYIYGQNFDMNFCFPEGEYYLAVYVDSTRRYGEISDETNDEDGNNNIWFSDTANIVVEARPFLTVENIQFRSGIFYREDEFPLTFDLVNVGCKPYLPGNEANVEISLQGNASSREADDQDNPELNVYPEYTDADILDRTLATVRDDRGMPVGKRISYKASLRVPMYNEYDVADAFSWYDVGDAQDWVRPIYPGFGVAAESPDNFPIGYLPQYSAGTLQNFDANETQPWESSEPFLDPRTDSSSGLLWDRLFLPDSAVNESDAYGLLLARDPAVMSLKFSISGEGETVWDIYSLEASPSILVDETPSSQTYNQWRTFWNVQRELAEFYGNRYGSNLYTRYFDVSAAELSDTDPDYTQLDYVGGPDDDPDNDGLTNNQEWAFVSDPLHADPFQAAISSDIVAVDGPGGNNGGVDPQALHYLQISFNALSDYSNSSWIYEVWASNRMDFNGFAEDETSDTVRLFRYDPRVLDQSDDPDEAARLMNNGDHLRSLNGVQSLIHNGYSYRITVRDNQVLDLEGGATGRYLTVRVIDTASDSEGPNNAGTPE
ncbi:MAG: hypothetical protein E1N59_2412 [Puniceicoccaceae bacterium 5H]|nr:MAG: hypothetical protein E1N59_2412 [Puniceicoccaceae bacterium 5H]